MNPEERSCLEDRAVHDFDRPTARSEAAGTVPEPETAFSWRKAASVAGLVGVAAVAAAAATKASSSNTRAAREERTVELGSGRSLHAVTAGSGRDIVLMHGAFATHRDWLDGPFAALAEVGRVIAIDRPGHGLSRRLRFEGGPRAHAVQIAEGLRVLGVVRPIFVAHSFGALSALSLAEQFPAEVAGLVLIAPLAFPEFRPLEHALFAPRALPFAGPLLASMAPAFDRPMLEAHHRIMFSPDKPPAEWKANYPWDQIIAPTGIIANGEDFSAVHPLRLDSYVDLDRVRAPVEVLSGTADLIIEDMRQGQVLGDRLPNAAVTRLEGVGHMLHHSHPDALLGAVQAMLERAILKGEIDART
jgi:pimeloyl-ACP methyl ester carboxylesterase